MENKIVRLIPVKLWNYEYRAKGEYIMCFNVGNGAYLNKNRIKGYVVQNGSNCKFIMNYKKAQEYHHSIFNK